MVHLHTQQPTLLIPNSDTANLNPKPNLMQLRAWGLGLTPTSLKKTVRRLCSVNWLELAFVLTLDQTEASGIVCTKGAVSG